MVEWLTADINDPGHQIMDDTKIVAEIAGCNDSNDQKSDEEEPVADTSVIPAAAFEALEVSLHWLESKNTETDHLLLVKKWLIRHLG